MVENQRASYLTVGIAILSFVVSVAALFAALRFETSEAERRDQEITALRSDLTADSKRLEVQQSILQLLGQRLSTTEPALDLYAFPIREYYNATDFSRESFIAESAAQRARFADSFLIIRDIDWDSAFITEDEAIVTATVQAFRRLHSDESVRRCHDSTGAQSQEVALRLAFERQTDGQLLIVAERSVALGPVLCV